MKIKLNITIDNILKWVYAILLVMDVNSVFYNLYTVNLHIPEITCLVVAILAIMSFINGGHVYKKVLSFLFIYMAFAVIFSMVSVDSDTYISYGVKFLIYIPIMLLLYTSDDEFGIDIIKKCSEFTCLLAILSLVMYLFYYFVPPFGTITIEWGSVVQRSNYIFFFAGQEQEIAGTYVMRNTGIFCEAPMYGFVLIMALSTQLFYYKKRNAHKIVLLIVTIVSTLSVSSIILAIVLIGMRYFLTDSVGDGNTSTIVVTHKKQLKYFFGIFAVAIGAFMVYYLLQFKINTGLSFTKRIDDYVAGYKAWKSSPIFGVGYDNYDAIKVNMLDWRLQYTQVGYSNSWMYILATCGICGFLLYFLSFLGAIRKSIKSKDLCITVQFLILILQMVTTTLAMHLFILNYVTFGLSYMLQSRKLCEGGGIVFKTKSTI